MSRSETFSFRNQIATLRATLRFHREHRRNQRQPESSPMGFKFKGNPDMEAGAFEIEETALVRRILRNSDVLINIGCNVGYYCCWALHAGKSVIAFEPMTANLHHLYQNILANRWQDKIEVFPVALSREPGIFKIFGSGTGASLVDGWAGASSQEFTLVPASTLDLVVQGRFYDQRCFVLVDIEGAELSMLEGATAFLARQPKPIWLVEIAIHEHQPAGSPMNPHLLKTFDIFWNAGYGAWTAHQAPRRIERPEVLRVVDSGIDSFGTHNFIFADSLPDALFDMVP